VKRLLIALALIPAALDAAPMRPLIRARMVSPIIAPLYRPMLKQPLFMLTQAVCADATVVKIGCPSGSAAGGGGAWGTITGTLSDQTDLQSALDAKIGDPGTVTDTALVRWNGTGGATVQDTPTLTYLSPTFVIGTAGAAGTISIIHSTGVGGSGFLSEGATADAFEFTFSFGDHTADQTMLVTAGADIEINSTLGGPFYFADPVFVADSIESVTTTKTTTARESGECYTTGDADGQTITLIDNATPVGSKFCFIVTQTQTSNSMSIAPDTGETLRLTGSSCATLTSTVIDSSVTIVATTGGSGGVWTVVSLVGTWVCN